jgi:hypothetical protein
LAGVVNQVDARRIAARIARRDINGGPRPTGKPRGPYLKKSPAPEATTPAAPDATAPP